MTEYIDRDELLLRLKKVVSTGDDFSLGMQMATSNAIECIKEAPAADVEEVVRCKNCKYFGKTIKNGKHACMNFQMPYCTDDDYCSHAVRRVE